MWSEGRLGIIGGKKTLTREGRFRSLGSEYRLGKKGTWGEEERDDPKEPGERVDSGERVEPEEQCERC